MRKLSEVRDRRNLNNIERNHFAEFWPYTKRKTTAIGSNPAPSTGGGSSQPVASSTYAFIERFDTAYVFSTDSGPSPDNKWNLQYKSNGLAQSTGGVFEERPEDQDFYDALDPGDTDTTRSVNMITRWKWGGMIVELDMKTIQQMRSNATPNAWEVAWVFIKYVDSTHHYYFIVKSNDQYEFGKKDYLPGQSGEIQIFLKTGSLPAGMSFNLNEVYHVKADIRGKTISIWLNGNFLFTFVDDGSTGKQAQTATLAGPGGIGLYNEDAHVAFDNITVIAQATVA